MVLRSWAVSHSFRALIAAVEVAWGCSLLRFAQVTETGRPLSKFWLQLGATATAGVSFVWFVWLAIQPIPWQAFLFFRIFVVQLVGVMAYTIIWVVCTAILNIKYRGKNFAERGGVSQRPIFRAYVAFVGVVVISSVVTFVAVLLTDRNLWNSVRLMISGVMLIVIGSLTTYFFYVLLKVVIETRAKTSHLVTPKKTTNLTPKDSKQSNSTPRGSALFSFKNKKVSRASPRGSPLNSRQEKDSQGIPLGEIERRRLGSLRVAHSPQKKQGILRPVFPDAVSRIPTNPCSSIQTPTGLKDRADASSSMIGVSSTIVPITHKRMSTTFSRTKTQGEVSVTVQTVGDSKEKLRVIDDAKQGQTKIADEKKEFVQVTRSEDDSIDNPTTNPKNSPKSSPIPYPNPSPRSDSAYSSGNKRTFLKGRLGENSKSQPAKVVRKVSNNTSVGTRRGSALPEKRGPHPLDSTVRHLRILLYLASSFVLVAGILVIAVSIDGLRSNDTFSGTIRQRYYENNHRIRDDFLLYLLPIATGSILIHSNSNGFLERLRYVFCCGCWGLSGDSGDHLDSSVR
ncbi:hypothetical protein AAMO2058_000018000 [Amorphochlora amoebiformis]